jgi:hypothetical protein
MRREIEDKKLIKTIDSFFIRKRGYVVKMPKPGSSVILLVSGGMDSITAWASLMADYKVKVYPVHILTGQPRNIYEQKSVRYYSTIFSKKYRKHFREPIFISQHSTPPEIRRYYRGDWSKWINPKIIAKNLRREKGNVVVKRKYYFPAFYPIQAIVASQFLELRDAQRLRNIFLTNLPSDSEYNTSQSVTVSSPHFGIQTF